ncbi:Type 1 glutamine amidotransferase-like domain-containing protein [Bacillus changyiensis]|uniref:Type 1 glutamine amidotransferase-like domain-containing protein n=1 Tax=Bacillus changyiensis TaxID=3004103 RepID=UPI0022E50315|nr:Type 1 glutamine amidotransferase-like domain-containing protein [Bacillus changyiensis]MDA1477351.1 Type 1 glutamine amidotransferase-like domain-containing protein [Bacillus changyiensis]
MKKLFLSGGGDADQTQKLDQRFTEEIDRKKPLLYIPVAMHASRFDDCYEWISSLFNRLGIKNITMWTNLDDRNIQDVEGFSSIYIGGGNTFQLLNQLINTDFIEILNRYTEHGGVVYGGSAGAIIFGKNIMTCSHMDHNTVGLNCFKGLGLVGEYSIWCHYQHNHDSLIQKYLEMYKTPVIALPEETGVLMCGQRLHMIGDKPAYVYKRDRNSVMIKDGDFINK